MTNVKQIEASILLGLQKGDTYSFEIMYVNYYDDLCFFLSRVCRDDSLCKDLVQEVFLNIWKKRKGMRVKTSLRSYLHKSVYNQYLMYLRQEKKQQGLLEQLRADAVYEYFLKEEPEEDIRLNKLLKAIERLPPKCKQAFILSKLEDRKYKEIAILMGISTKTVEIHISKALGLLRKIQFLF